MSSAVQTAVAVVAELARPELRAIEDFADKGKVQKLIPGRYPDRSMSRRPPPTVDPSPHVSAGKRKLGNKVPILHWEELF